MNLFDRFVQRYGRLPTEFDPDYLEMLRMTKYRILSRPDVTQANCANCGGYREDGRKYVDFGLNIEFHGAVFLCTLCLDDIARNAGLYRALEVRILQLETQLQTQKGAELSAQELQGAMLKIFDEVKQHLDTNLPASGNPNFPGSNSSVDSDKEPSKSGTDPTKSGTDKSKSGTVKSPPVSGSKNLSSLADLIDKDD